MLRGYPVFDVQYLTATILSQSNCCSPSACVAGLARLKENFGSRSGHLQPCLPVGYPWGKTVGSFHAFDFDAPGFFPSHPPPEPGTPWRSHALGLDRPSLPGAERLLSFAPQPLTLASVPVTFFTAPPPHFLVISSNGRSS